MFQWREKYLEITQVDDYRAVRDILQDQLDIVNEKLRRNERLGLLDPGSIIPLLGPVCITMTIFIIHATKLILIFHSLISFKFFETQIDTHWSATLQKILITNSDPTDFLNNHIFII